MRPFCRSRFVFPRSFCRIAGLRPGLFFFLVVAFFDGFGEDLFFFFGAAGWLAPKREKLIFGKRNVLDPRGPKEVIKVLDGTFKSHFSFCNGRVVSLCAMLPTTIQTTIRYFNSFRVQITSDKISV